MSDKIDKASYVGISENTDAEGKALPLRPAPKVIKTEETTKNKGKKRKEKKEKARQQLVPCPENSANVFGNLIYAATFK